MGSKYSRMVSHWKSHDSRQMAIQGLRMADENSCDIITYTKGGKLEGVLTHRFEPRGRLVILRLGCNPGQGIGTALVKQLAKHFGGPITVAPTPEAEGFYRKLGFEWIKPNPRTKEMEMTLTPQAAERLLG